MTLYRVIYDFGNVGGEETFNNEASAMDLYEKLLEQCGEVDEENEDRWVEIREIEE